MLSVIIYSICVASEQPWCLTECFYAHCNGRTWKSQAVTCGPCKRRRGQGYKNTRMAPLNTDRPIPFLSPRITNYVNCASMHWQREKKALDQENTAPPQASYVSLPVRLSVCLSVCLSVFVSIYGWPVESSSFYFLSTTLLTIYIMNQGVLEATGY